jgi:hypothetical protein
MFCGTAQGFLILRRAHRARLEGRGNRFQWSLETPSSFETRAMLAPQDEGYGVADVS